MAHCCLARCEGHWLAHNESMHAGAVGCAFGAACMHQSMHVVGCYKRVAWPEKWKKTSPKCGATQKQCRASARVLLCFAVALACMLACAPTAGGVLLSRSECMHGTNDGMQCTHSMTVHGVSCANVQSPRHRLRLKRTYMYMQILRK